MSNYLLIVRETGKKAGKFNYKVVDQTGLLISERNSNREYVACTADGRFYFGRVDLVGKGDHGKYLKMCLENGTDPSPVAYKE